jgi:hypothetical protein
VADDVEPIGPDLSWLHARKQVKERTRWESKFNCRVVVRTL